MLPTDEPVARDDQLANREFGRELAPGVGRRDDAKSAPNRGLNPIAVDPVTPHRGRSRQPERNERADVQPLVSRRRQREPMEQCGRAVREHLAGAHPLQVCLTTRLEREANVGAHPHGTERAHEISSAKSLPRNTVSSSSLDAECGTGERRWKRCSMGHPNTVPCSNPRSEPQPSNGGNVPFHRPWCGGVDEVTPVAQGGVRHRATCVTSVSDRRRSRRYRA